MCTDFVNLTAENLADERLCCIIRSKKPHPGVEAKRQWLSERLKEGHAFRKLNEKATVFIEYAPLETLGFPSLVTTIIMYIAYGFPAVTKEKGMENR